MTSRIAQLAARRRLLLAQSAVERETLRLDATAIGEALQTVDRAVSLVRRLKRSPWVMTAAVVGLVVLRRYPVTGWVMRGIAIAGTAHRVGTALHRLAAAPAPDEAAGR